MKWTEDQEKAIFANPAEIVVSAAAGSGKTQILTTRIIERLKQSDNPVSIEKLLIVTFTKAAAAEMRERIGKALKNAVKAESDASLRKHLKKQLTLLGSAHICTIDSFCYDVVKQNFFTVNLPSDIAIGEQGELALLKLSALEDTIDALYCALEKKKGNNLSEDNLLLASLAEDYFTDKEELDLILDGFEALTNTCSYDKRDSDFSENIKGNGDYSTMISSLYSKAQSAAYPDLWLKSASDAYNPEITNYEDTVFYKHAFSECTRIIDNSLHSLKELEEISIANGIGYEQTLRNDYESLFPLSECSDYNSLYAASKNKVFFADLKGRKRNVDKELADSIKNARASIKDNVNETLKKLIEFSLEECDSLRIQLYPQIKALSSAASLLGDIYYRKMVARKIIDFSACEHLAMQIISEDGINLSDVGVSLKNKYDEIYIDEMQDSNELQEMLFSFISKGRSFMVGDVKQSIYGFRNADPSIFMKKCNDSEFDEVSPKRKIFLAKNFRSKKRVIDGVNSIFDVVMTRSVCSIDYKAEHRLLFGTDFIPEKEPSEKCEIAIISESGNSTEQTFNEACYIASEIKKIIAEKKQVWDKYINDFRDAEYRDFSILMRALKNYSQIYEEAFALHGIPCYIDGSSDLYETTEVGQIIEILKLIDNAQSDISLACTLRSPMFMFDENELLEIKLQSKESFCDAFYGICDKKYSVRKALREKCKAFKSQLDKWRFVSGFMSVEDIIQRIYIDTGIYSNVLAFPDGQLRRANLDLLLEKAAEFERSSYSGLFNFVNYVRNIKKTSDSTSEAKAINEKMNVVRIMTIHKSKGLEFPYVFVANCAKSYKSASVGAGGLIVNSRVGIGMNVINPLLRCKYNSPPQTVLLNMASKDDKAEEMRLLYVALTRAREKIYVVATLKNYEAFEKLQLCPSITLTADNILSCKSYIALIALAFSRGGDKHWNLSFKSPTDNKTKEESKEDFKSLFCENSEISAMLAYEYPHREAVFLPNKASVSLLKSADINLAPASDGNIPMLNTPSCKRVSLKKPQFRSLKSGGVFFGNTHHKVLQYIDYNGASVKEQCDEFLKSGIISAEEREIISIEKIELFLSSPLGERLKKSPSVHREEPFVISVKASEIQPSLPDDETICVQGIIDCYFEEDGCIVLVDYKTDAYDKPDEIVKKYEKQLYYYEKALKRKCKDKLIKKYLYLLYKNDIIEL